jgi:hypothetical protein
MIGACVPLGFFFLFFFFAMAHPESIRAHSALVQVNLTAIDLMREKPLPSIPIIAKR